MTETAPIQALSGLDGEPGSEGRPRFTNPVALDLDDDQRQEIAKTISDLYRDIVQSRQAWTKRHLDYDLMFRGTLDADRDGPWPGSSNLHVQMPYWLCDAYNTRLVSGIWDQTPVVVGHAQEDADSEVANNAASLVDWHFQPKRMNARAAWSRISKTRCIHGRGVGIIPWVKDEYTYRVAGGIEYKTDEKGSILVDSDMQPIESESSRPPLLKRATRMNGPLLVPVDWDDVLEPMEGTNIQPVSQSNPYGADYVGIRQWEPLSLIWRKRANSYPYIDDDEILKDRSKWSDLAPSQDRSGSGTGGSENQQATKLQDYVDGKNRNILARARGAKARNNPEFEIISWFMPYELENEKGELEEAECVFFYMVEPSKVLGAFRLTDLQWKNKRPLLELDFQTVGTRRDSMGICEIVQHLSAELDTIHNMRIDVGFATNMPFFFYRSTSILNPERIVLRPGKGIPVDDVRDVQFPQLQSVTSFYYQEEQLLYSLVERVLGITDLFLGVSPTRGAAARHATGFVGTQQEALARTSEVINGDAQSFSSLAHMTYELEMQFGPEERMLRLQGREGPMTRKLDREELWFRGEYDLTLGANHGMYSMMLKQQQSQGLTQLLPVSTLINGDPSRRWEAEREILEASGLPDVQRFIGPRSAVGPGAQKEWQDENGEMDQEIFGENAPAPVHPNDNDPDHLRGHMEHIQSEAFIALGRPNLQGHLAHIQATNAQMQRKAEAQRMQALTAQGGDPSQQGPAGPQGPGGAQPNARNVAALESAQSGSMGELPKPPNMNGGSTGQPGGPQPAAGGS